MSFITRLGRDPFADMAFATWKEAGVTPAVTQAAESYTGAAYIFIEDRTGVRRRVPDARGKAPRLAGAVRLLERSRPTNGRPG